LGCGLSCCKGFQVRASMRSGKVVYFIGSLTISIFCIQSVVGSSASGQSKKEPRDYYRVPDAAVMRELGEIPAGPCDPKNTLIQRGKTWSGCRTCSTLRRMTSQNGLVIGTAKRTTPTGLSSRNRGLTAPAKKQKTSMRSVARITFSIQRKRHSYWPESLLNSFCQSTTLLPFKSFRLIP
jgi:hypothetical protein